MTKDLEETIAELGPGYRDVVERLQAAYRPCALAPAEEPRRGHFVRHLVPYLVAASLALALAFGVVFRPAAARRTSEAALVYTIAYAPTEQALAAIVAGQRADGSWANDFLTRQNAAALRSSTDGVCRIAYKRAVRYLHAHGLEPLTDLELKQRGDYAAQAVARL